MSVKLSGGSFKTLIGGVAKFSSAVHGSFIGSELVNLRSANGVMEAVSYALILSRARCRADGDLPLVAVDYRLLVPFAQIAKDRAEVIVEVKDKVVLFKCGPRRVEAAVVPGREHKIPGKAALEKIVALTLTPEQAEKVSYLSELAFSDVSKPELCRAYLTGAGTVLAVNQKAMGSLTVGKVMVSGGDGAAGGVAVPLTLGKALSAGDILYVSPESTVLKSGGALYIMPSPVEAQKSFPVAMIETMGKTDRDSFAVCSGQSLVAVLQERDIVLGGMARTEVRLKLITAAGRLAFSAERGGARYRSSLPARDVTDGVDVMLPMEEVIRAAPALAKSGKVTLSRGKKNSEVFLTFADGWLAFPAWAEKKK